MFRRLTGTSGPLGVFRHRTYARLFAAQVVALLGTGLLTVALALLAYDLAGAAAGAVLGTALTIKIATYVIVSPLASALTARFDARRVMVSADLVRAGIAALLPMVDAVWQVYVLILVLQAASATFTPTFQAVIPAVLPVEDDYTRALTWSSIAYDLESLASPTIAAVLLTVMSFHDLFVGTVIGFLGSAALVVGTPLPAMSVPVATSFRTRLTGGIRSFLSRPRLRALLALDLVLASSTALVLVNTVVLARDTFGVGERAVPVALACFGAGSILAALVTPGLLRHRDDRVVMVGAALLTVLGIALSAVLIAGAGDIERGWPVLLGLWAMLGALGTAVAIPSSRLVVRASSPDDRQSLFSAQFSLSHACYLVTYPLAGFAGSALGQGWAAALLALVATAAVAGAVCWWPSSNATLDR